LKIMKMAPFVDHYTTSYQGVIISIALSGIFDVDEYSDLEI